ncbi:MAG: LrgB family protein [Romboutsia sp.]
MYNILDTPIFGIIVTILFFNIGLYLHKKTKNPLVNPLLVSMVGIIVFLNISKIPYESYKVGADNINFLLGPVTIILAVPLYKQFGLFKKYIKEILIGISCGVAVSFISIIIIGNLTNANIEIINSLIPKSITTPMGIYLTKSINGIEAITVVSIILTGILGAIIAPVVFKIGKIKHPIAKGIALGTSAHALGTTKALELGEVEGAMSGLSIGISGIITVILIPIIINMIS